MAQTVDIDRIRADAIQHQHEADIRFGLLNMAVEREELKAKLAAAIEELEKLKSMDNKERQSVPNLK